MLKPVYFATLSFNLPQEETVFIFKKNKVYSVSFQLSPLLKIILIP